MTNSTIISPGTDRPGSMLAPSIEIGCRWPINLTNEDQADFQHEISYQTYDSSFQKYSNALLSPDSVIYNNGLVVPNTLVSNEDLNNYQNTMTLPKLGNGRTRFTAKEVGSQVLGLNSIIQAKQDFDKSDKETELDRGANCIMMSKYLLVLYDLGINVRRQLREFISQLERSVATERRGLNITPAYGSKKLSLPVSNLISYSQQSVLLVTTG
ncbi:MAG: hypothetical protein WKF92_09950 [Pyrinomonadaceae bacterium]